MDLQRPEDFYIKKLLEKVRVREIMTTPVITLNVDDNFSLVPKTFNQYNIRHLPIVGPHGHLAGIISQRDLYRIIAPHKLDDGGWSYDQQMLDSEILSKVMTVNPSTLFPDDSVGKALVEFVRTKYGCFPVIDHENHLKGIVTQIDILKIAVQIFLE